MSSTFIAVHNEKIVTKSLDQVKEWVENERGAFFEVFEERPLIKLCARKANILMQEHIKEFPKESAMFKKIVEDIRANDGDRNEPMYQLGLEYVNEFETDQYFHIAGFAEDEDELGVSGLTRYGVNSNNVAYQLCRKIFGSDIADASSLKIINDWDEEFFDYVSL